jgi:pimeloyl-ACP methyl ester carboxylesterase
MPPVTALEKAPFFGDVRPAQRVQGDFIDVHTSAGSADEPRPAVVFVHGGPLPRDVHPRPRAQPVFIGYGALDVAEQPPRGLDVLDTGHFAWEEAPEQYAAIVTAWVNGGYLAGSAGHQW